MQIADCNILQGHNLEVLKTLPDESVQCCITSPPYYGLRDYGLPPQIWGGAEGCLHIWSEEFYQLRSNDNKGNNGDEKQRTNAGTIGLDKPIGHGFCTKCNAWRGCLGLEPTPQLYIKHLVELFLELKRVLRSDGTIWLNLGDSYANDPKWGGNSGEKNYTSKLGKISREKRITGFKPKDLMMMPHRVAIALQDAGFWVRQDIVWSKLNAMPEPVTDRCTKSHEYIFLITKSEKYFFDHIAIQEPARFDGRKKTVFDGSKKHETPVMPGSVNYSFYSGGHERWQTNTDGEKVRNKRSVWNVATANLPDAHFATFPEKLIEPCILAGTSAKGCCSICGASFIRIVEKNLVPGIGASFNSKPDERDFSADRNDQGSNRAKDGHKPGWVNIITTKSWRQSCECLGSEAKPSVVIDIFHGSGTTGRVALKHNRSYIGIELNPEYLEISGKRLTDIQVELF